MLRPTSPELAAKQCPTCNLVHPGSAVRCECGYSFTSGKQRFLPGRERREQEWHENPYVAVTFLFICWPAGIYLTWKNKRLTPNQKALLTVGWFALFALFTFLRFSGADTPNGP